MARTGNQDFGGVSRAFGLPNSIADGQAIAHGQAIPIPSFTYAAIPVTGLPPLAIARCSDFPIFGNILILWNGTEWMPYRSAVSEEGYESIIIGPSSAAVLTEIGVSLSKTGTVSNPEPGPGTIFGEWQRYLISSSATAGVVAFWRSTTRRLWRGNVASKGGFDATFPFSLVGMQVGQRGFFGIDTGTASPTNIDPLTSTTLGKIGIAFSSNTGNLSLIHNVAGTAPTVISLGANFPIAASTIYELRLRAIGGSTSVDYWVTNKMTGNATSGQLTTNIPTATTIMAPVHWVTNNATAASVSFSGGTSQTFYR